MKRLVARATRACLVAIVGTVIAACGSSPSSTSNPCDLLPAQSAKSMLGTKVTQTTRPSECDYVSSDGIYLSVSYGDSTAENATAHSLWDRVTASNSRYKWNLTTVSGTQALWVAYPQDVGGGGRLIAFANRYGIYVDVNSKASSDPENTARTALGTVLTKINR